MAWPGSVPYRDTNDAVVLIPSDTARVQDLGPFLSGRNLETDIVRGSALVAAAEGGSPCLDGQGRVFFGFEGNTHRAANLHRFHEKTMCAAGRLAEGYPSISYGRAAPEELHVVARYDLERFVFTEIVDAPALEAWAGEPVAGFMPPPIETPCADPEILKPLYALPLEPAFMRGRSVFMWKFQNGQVVLAEEAKPHRLLSPGDTELDDILDRWEAEEDERRKILGTRIEDLMPRFGS